MQQLNFSVNIDAPPQKVWAILWDDKTYPQWTAEFGGNGQESRAISDWKEGSKVHFLAGNEGMYSMIDKLSPNEYISFRHIGMVKNGEEQPIDEATKEWSGATENYTLKETDDKTQLSVSVETTDSDLDRMREAFPKAFNKVKELSER